MAGPVDTIGAAASRLWLPAESERRQTVSTVAECDMILRQDMDKAPAVGWAPPTDPLSHISGNPLRGISKTKWDRCPAITPDSIPTAISKRISMRLRLILSQSDAALALRFLRCWTLWRSSVSHFERISVAFAAIPMPTTAECACDRWFGDVGTSMRSANLAAAHPPRKPPMISYNRSAGSCPSERQ